MKYLLPLVILLVGVAGSSAFAQTEEPAPTKPSPYDLITSYYENDFRPFARGNGYVGLAFSLQDKSLANTQRLLDKVIDANELNYNIEVKGGYFIGDYVMVGLTFQYEQQKFDGVVVRDPDTVQSQRITRRFTAVPLFKPYFPVTKNGRLSFFVEIGAGFGGGNSLVRETKNLDEVTKTETRQFVFSMGLTPGLTFFAIENFAFEVGVNVIGYSFRRTESVINEVETAVDKRNNVNLNLNLLALQLGIAYYL